MLKILGWGQDPISAFDYRKIRDLSSVDIKKDWDTVFGWSLGGQIAISLIARNIISAKKLVLAAVPFQFVADNQFPQGISPTDYQDFFNSYSSNHIAAQKQFAILIAGKNHAKYLHQDIGNKEDWIYWLKFLGEFSCKNIDFSNFPATRLIYSSDDKIVNIAQGELLRQKIPDSKLEIVKNGFHIPHLFLQF